MYASKWKNDEEDLGNILRQVAEGGIKIPIFQRNYVWSSKDIEDFLNSIKDGSPLGNIIFWKTNEKMNIRNSMIDLISNKNKEEISYVIDGQQRLTTLIICYYFDSFISSDEVNLSRFKKIVYDVEENKFKVVSIMNQNNKNYYQLNEVFFLESNHRKIDEMFEKRYKKNEEWTLSQEEQQDIKYQIEDINKIFQTLKIGILVLNNTNNLDNVIDIFEKINTKGKKLTTFDIVNAKWNQHNIKLENEFKDIIDKPQQFFLKTNSIDDEVLLDSLFLIIRNDKCIYAKLDKINFEIKNDEKLEILEKIKKYKESVKYAANCLYNLGFNSKTIPSKNIFKWMVYLFFKNNNKILEANRNAILKKYIALLCLNNWYEKNSTERLKENIKFVNFLLKEDEQNYKNILQNLECKTKLNSKFFIDLDSNSKTDMSAKLITSVLQNQCRDFLTNYEIDKNDFELHHVYPRKAYSDITKSFKEVIDYIDSYANLTPILKDTNRNIKSKKFSLYFEEYKNKSNNDLEKNLKSHCINYELWKHDSSPDKMIEAIKNRSHQLAKLLSEEFGIEYIED